LDRAANSLSKFVYSAADIAYNTSDKARDYVTEISLLEVGDGALDRAANSLSKFVYSVADIAYDASNEARNYVTEITFLEVGDGALNRACYGAGEVVEPHVLWRLRWWKSEKVSDVFVS